MHLLVTHFVGLWIFYFLTILEWRDLLPLTASSDFDELVSMTTDKMRDSDPKECE